MVTETEVVSADRKPNLAEGQTAYRGVQLYICDYHGPSQRCLGNPVLGWYVYDLIGNLHACNSWIKDGTPIESAKVSSAQVK